MKKFREVFVKEALSSTVFDRIQSIYLTIYRYNGFKLKKTLIFTDFLCYSKTCNSFCIKIYYECVGGTLWKKRLV